MNECCTDLIFQNFSVERKRQMREGVGRGRRRGLGRGYYSVSKLLKNTISFPENFILNK